MRRLSGRKREADSPSEACPEAAYPPKLSRESELGTSTLHYVLRSGWHPRVALNKGEKEVHHFSLDDNHAMGPARYQAREGAATQQVDSPPTAVLPDKAPPRFSAVPREARARTSHTPPAGRHQPRETSLDQLRSHKPARHGGTARAQSWALAQAARTRCCGLARPSRLWSAPLHNGRCRQVRGEVSATYLDYPRAAERASTRISLCLSRGIALHRGRCEQARFCAAPLRQGRAAAARACGAPRLLLQPQY